MRTIPRFQGIDGVFFIQMLRDIPIVAPYDVLSLIRQTYRHGEENRLWLRQYVARNASIWSTAVSGPTDS